MQYISPSILLKDVSAAPTDKKNLTLAKKKMLAELELNGGTTITFNNKEFTKNDIINYFDNAQQDESLAYHVAIANDVFLLKFLENNVLENRHGFAKNELYSDPAFIDWVSPYFFTSFTTFGIECIRKTNAEDWIALLDSPMLMNDKFKAQAWDLFEEEFTYYLTHLRSFTTDKPTIGLNDLNRLCNFNFTRILQKLPAHRFYNLHDAYATAMGNAAIYAFRKGERSISGIYIDNAISLAFSKSVKADLEKRRNDWDEAMQRIGGAGGHTASGASSGGGGMSTVAIIRIIVIIVVALFRIASCSHN